MTQLKLKQ